MRLPRIMRSVRSNRLLRTFDPICLFTLWANMLQIGNQEVTNVSMVDTHSSKSFEAPTSASEMDRAGIKALWPSQSAFAATKERV
jgi:hypothetical protein